MLPGLKAAALLLLLAVGLASAAVPSAPSVERVNWSYTQTIQSRVWSQPAPQCLAWDNSSGSVCTSWSYPANVWSCQQRTYLFTPTSLIFSLLSRAASGYAENFSIGGLWSLAPAGQKALNGLSAFNANYCFNEGNATAQDVSDMQGELLAIGLTEVKGKKQQYVPVATDQQFTATGSTEAKIKNTGREAVFRFGNHSITVTFTSSGDFDAGTKWNTTTSANSVILSRSGSTPYEQDPTGTLANDGISNETLTGFADQGTSWGHFNLSTGIYEFTYEFEFQLSSETGASGMFMGLGNGSGRTDSTGDSYFVGARMGDEGGGVGLWTFRAAEWRNGVESASANANVDARSKLYFRETVWDTYYTLRIYTDALRTVEIAGSPMTLTLAPKANRGSFTYAYVAGFDGLRANNHNAWTDNHLLNNSTLWPLYVRNGSWSSTVLDGGSQWNRWVNFTNSSTMAANTGMDWQVRTGNSSWTQNATSPAWTPLGNLSSGVNALANISRYIQLNATLWSNGDTATPQLDAFIVNSTWVPNSTANFTANVSYAAPGQPVLVGVAYQDNESAQARLALWNNSSSPSFYCNNTTFATGNGTAFCAFLWNRTDDNTAPSTCGTLTDYDGAANETNCSAPVTTDSQPPTVVTSSIANTSTGSFALAIYRADSASGINRTWFSLYNLSNNTAGDTPLAGNWTNTTLWSNDTLSLCQGVSGGRPACMGQIRVAATADDSVGTSPTDGFRHWSGYSNVTFWFDPPPVVDALSVIPNGTVTVSDPSGYVVNVSCNIQENLTDLASVVVRQRDPSLATADFAATRVSGTNASGTWQANVTQGNFGTFSYACVARDVSTTTTALTSYVSLSLVQSGGSGSSSGPAGGGAGGAQGATATPSPAPEGTEAARNRTLPQLVAPIQMNQFLFVSPLNPGQARWSQVWQEPPGLPPPEDCRVLVPFECVVQNQEAPYTVTFSLERAGVDLAWDNPATVVHSNATIFLQGLTEPVRGSISVTVINGKSPVWYPAVGGFLGGVVYLRHLKKAKLIRARVAAAKARGR